MKNPPHFENDDSALESFVIAATSPSLESACDLLFVHGNDLTWGNIGFGLFLVEVNTGDNFKEVVEVAEARAKLSLTSIVEPLLKVLEPRFVKVVAELKNEGNEAPAD